MKKVGKKSTDISVIIPTFNEEKYITRCLSALANQKTHFSYEILVVDHNSTDKTIPIAKKYKTRIIQEEIRGTAVARQAGVNNANSTIVAFTEADCIPPNDWIERIGNHFLQHPDDVGITGRYYFDDANKGMKLVSLQAMALGNYLVKILKGNFPFRGTNSAGRKDIILKAGGFREEGAPFDDADCSNRVAKYGNIYFDQNLTVVTSSRRVKGRFFTYAREFIFSAFMVFVLKKKGDIRWYKIIR